MIIEWSKVETMGTDEIENLRVELSKEIQTISDNKFIISDEYNNVKKQIIILQGKLQDLKISKEKAGHTIQQKKTDLDILETKYWQKRKGF